MVDVPATVDRHVLHGQWPRASLLHRAVLAARIRELHAWRCHPAVATRDLERAGLSIVSRGAVVRQAARGVRELRTALEPLTVVVGSQALSDGASSRMTDVARTVVLIIPTLNEAASIGAVVRSIPREIVGRIIVADGGSSDDT